MAGLRGMVQGALPVYFTARMIGASGCKPFFTFKMLQIYCLMISGVRVK